MKKIKERFNEDPIFATGLIITAAIVGTQAVRGIAKLIESSAYAYRASKL